MNRETCEYALYAEKTVVEKVEDSVMEISLADAKMKDSKFELGDIVQIPIESKSFGRIATQNAKNLILQKIREEERKVVYDQYFEKEKDIVTGIVQRYVGKNISINLGKADALLTENEQVKGEVFKPTERIKLYVVEVKNTTKGPKILVSRTHPELVKRLFESEVTEVKDGIVERIQKHNGIVDAKGTLAEIDNFLKEINYKYFFKRMNMFSTIEIVKGYT
jgi:N utilization substance protein A